MEFKNASPLGAKKMLCVLTFRLFPDMYKTTLQYLHSPLCPTSCPYTTYLTVALQHCNFQLPYVLVQWQKPKKRKKKGTKARNIQRINSEIL